MRKETLDQHHAISLMTMTTAAYLADVHKSSCYSVGFAMSRLLHSKNRSTNTNVVLEIDENWER
jgi:hypothetical protein